MDDNITATATPTTKQDYIFLARQRAIVRASKALVKKIAPISAGETYVSYHKRVMGGLALEAVECQKFVDIEDGIARVEADNLFPE